MQALPSMDLDKFAPAGIDGAPPATTPHGASSVRSERGTRRNLRGTVISSRMQKTITVRVERVFKHAKYKKYIRRHKKYHAHDEENIARLGDEVEIRQCRPLSKLKRWRLISVLRRAKLADGGVE